MSMLARVISHLRLIIYIISYYLNPVLLPTLVDAFRRFASTISNPLTTLCIIILAVIPEVLCSCCVLVPMYVLHV